MLEKIKEFNVKESNGKKSFAVKTESGKSGLITSNYIAKDLGGKEPSFTVGQEVELDFETVNKSDGSGTWTAVKIKSLEVPKTGGGGGGGFNKPFVPKPQEDPIGKLVNTCVMSAATIWASQPHDEDASFVQFFSTVIDAAVLKYVEHKGK